MPRASGLTGMLEKAEWHQIPSETSNCFWDSFLGILGRELGNRYILIQTRGFSIHFMFFDNILLEKGTYKNEVNY